MRQLYIRTSVEERFMLEVATGVIAYSQLHIYLCKQNATSLDHSMLKAIELFVAKNVNVVTLSPLVLGRLETTYMFFFFLHCCICQTARCGHLQFPAVGARPEIILYASVTYVWREWKFRRPNMRRNDKNSRTNFRG